MATLKGINYTLLIGPGVPVPVPHALIEALESAQVTVAAGQRSGFQLTFGISKNSIISKTLLPAGFFDPLVRVIMIATINGIPEVLCDGVITRQELTPSNVPGASKLTITGEDLSVLMDLIDLTGTIPYPAMPAQARVALILAKYAMFGIIPLPVPPMFMDLPNPVDKIPVHKGTDLAYLTALAKEIGYVFYVEAGPAPGTSTAYWGPEIRVGVPQPALTINSDTQSNVETLSFSMDGTARTQYYLLIQNELTKIPIPIPLPDIGILKPPLSARPPIPLKFEQVPVARLKSADAIARGLGKMGASNDAVSSTGTLDVLRYGRILKARQLVGVRGASLGYDGLYYVKSVTTSVKRGEIKQSFALVRDGLVSNVPMVAA